MGVAARRERRVAFHTFGCKLNQFETEALASSFLAQGFAVVPADQEADAYVINTCTVTSRADHKARSLIRAIARSHRHAPLIVTGCSAQAGSDALSGLAADILVVPQSEKARLLELPRNLAEILDSGERPFDRLAALLQPHKLADPFAFSIAAHAFHTRAFLKIQDGCDCRCAYCVVPLARGRSVSLGLEEAASRAAALESQGRREIVLTGVNISAWQASGTDLSGLLRRLLRATKRARLRLTSIEPESITPELVEALADPRICPHFHIPVQSGSDAVLLRMRRRYLLDKVVDGVRRLREARRDPFIAADVVVGFPGETEGDFQSTREMIRQLEFAALHVFPFSPRPGTAAAMMKPVVPERVRRERARDLIAMGRENSAAYAGRWQGRDVDVLLEGKPGSRAHGVSENYLKVSVSGAPQDSALPGRVVRARITSAEGACKSQFLGYVD